MCHQSTAPYVVPVPLRLIGHYFTGAEQVVMPTALDTHDLAWAAGFFEGEGSTYLSRVRASGAIQLCTEVSQVHPEVLEHFHRAVGGVGSMRVRPDTRNSRRKPMWSYYTRSWRPTLTVLTVLWPYLGIVKRDQAGRVFAEYQAEADRNPLVGRPNVRHLWTATTCPLGHTDIYVTQTGRYPLRRCRVCRRERTRVGYQTK